ncbi:spermidine/putrescine-binding protein [Bradyrhizobium sp. GM2.4]
MAIGDVNKVLNTPERVARAFKKLDTIKKDVIWWTAGAQPPQLLADGQVVMNCSLERPHLRCGQQFRQAP